MCGWVNIVAEAEKECPAILSHSTATSSVLSVQRVDGLFEGARVNLRDARETIAHSLSRPMQS